LPPTDSELSNVTVAVIEAGGSVLNNFNITYVEGHSLAFDTDIDWAYQTEEHIYAGDLKQTIRAGKAIGGTSTINGNCNHIFSIRNICV
jgi:choline dehydrogenase-like flavoprotein